MPDNEITVTFNAEDNISNVANKIDKNIEGIFDPAGIARVGEAFTIATAAAIGVGIAIEKIGKEFGKVVKLSEERPDLFTDEEIRNVDTYSEGLSNLGDALNNLRLEHETELMRQAGEYMNLWADATNTATENTGYLRAELARSAVEQANLSNEVDSATQNYQAMALAAQNSADEIVIGGKNSIASIERLSGASDEATNKIVYNNLLQRLSINGITEAEFEMATSAGIALGIFDEKTAALALGIDKLTTDVIEGRLEVENLGGAIDSLQDRTVNIRINTIGSVPNLAGMEQNFRVNAGQGRAAGGPVNRGETYVVGERGPELFTPGQSGNITPNHQMGGMDEERLGRIIGNVLARYLQ